MANAAPTDLLDRMRNSAALQRSIGLHTGADLLDSAVTTIEDLTARVAVLSAMDRHPSGQHAPRVITTRDEAFALHAGAVVVNGTGTAFQLKPRPEALAGYIDHATAAFLLPLTVIHEGDR